MSTTSSDPDDEGMIGELAASSVPETENTETSDADDSAAHMKETREEIEAADTGQTDEAYSEDQTERFLNPVDALDIAIPLEFVLTELQLPFSEIAALRNGSVIGLDKTLTDPVEIRANGYPLGSGYLYRVGDQIGVKISNWRAGGKDR